MNDILSAARRFSLSAPLSYVSSALNKIQRIVDAFSASGRLIFSLLAGLLVVSSAGLLFLLNENLLVTVPAHGGSLSEGIVGAPRFINPVLAVSDADDDLTALVYSGLLKATPEGGYTPDLAESYTISPDGKIYTVVLKNNAKFQDGTAVTADDILFTISKTQDPVLKSPQQANWTGVTVEEVDQHTVRFTLAQAYAPFIEDLTLGILPKHLWQGVSDTDFPLNDLNTSPVGSGPFKVGSITRTSSGVPTSYTLGSFGDYALGAPYLDSLTLHFYQNENDLLSALKSGQVAAASGISPEAISQLKGFPIQTAPLDRVFGVFFNQNQSAVLRDAMVRQALSDAVDRAGLISSVLGGYGVSIDGPVPPGVLAGAGSTLSSASTDSTSSPQAATDLAAEAQQKLIAAGWKFGPSGFLEKTTGTGKKATTQQLAFTLTTGNVQELRAVADYLKTTWGRMGANVTVQVYDQGDLTEQVIRPRSYDALLFGEVVGRELDLFAFWDSSQRVDPGLNIALYANALADKALEQLRQTSDPSTRAKLYAQFNAQIQKDMPAIFLYAPDFVYTIPKGIQGVNLGLIESPSDRYLSVAGWHQETDHVWPLFIKK